MNAIDVFDDPYISHRQIEFGKYKCTVRIFKTRVVISYSAFSSEAYNNGVIVRRIVTFKNHALASYLYSVIDSPIVTDDHLAIMIKSLLACDRHDLSSIV